MCICICKCDLKIVALKGSTASSAYTQSLPYCVSKTSNQSLKTKIRRKTNQSLHDLVRIYTVAALLRFNFFFCKTQKGSDCEQNVQNKNLKTKTSISKQFQENKIKVSTASSLHVSYCPILMLYKGKYRDMCIHTYIYTFKVAYKVKKRQALQFRLWGEKNRKQREKKNRKQRVEVKRDKLRLWLMKS